MKTRLEQLCEAFGWQGGTIHDANRMAAQVLGRSYFDALKYDEDVFREHLHNINERMLPEDLIVDSYHKTE